jgi:hypothetical protein
MRVTTGAALILVLAAAGEPTSIPAPRLAEGDSWTYAATTEDKTGWHQRQVRSTVEHASALSIAVSNQEVGAPTPAREILFGPEWSRVRSVNGKEVVVNRPLAFPLAPGKGWTLGYTEDHPTRDRLRQEIRLQYSVVGWEDVTVPAGTFHALKIEADGSWTGVNAPSAGAVAGTHVDAGGSTTVTQTQRSGPSTVTGRLYKALWYAPAVKRWVKLVEEDYSGSGTRNARATNELTAFKVAN